jgi:peptidylprolyl isomerase
MTKQQFFIYFLVGLMIFSAIGTGILLLTQSSDSPSTEISELQPEFDETQLICQVSPEVANQPGNAEGDWPVALEEPATELEVTDVRVGTGEVAEVGSCITAHYRLSESDGTPVAGNDTFVSGQPFTAELVSGGLIEGWVQGIPGMREGGLRRLVVPAELAYGEGTLIFDVELVKVEY